MYIIIELQTTDGITSNIVQTKETRAEAMSTYHSILSSAAMSSVECHTALVVDEQGKTIARECYIHVAPAEPIEEVI